MIVLCQLGVTLRAKSSEARNDVGENSGMDDDRSIDGWR